MTNPLDKLRPALKEVHNAAHNQDLVEVPKRAEAERRREQTERK